MPWVAWHKLLSVSAEIYDRSRLDGTQSFLSSNLTYSFISDHEHFTHHLNELKANPA